MLRSVRELEKFRVLTRDGLSRGRIRDAWFDDRTWNITHLVVSIEPRKFGLKQVLIDPRQVLGFDDAEGRVRLSLSLEELDESPLAGSILPVCRQYSSMAFASPGAASASGRWTGANPHLRSSRAVTSYEICVAGESGGRLADFIFEDAEAQIRYLAIEETIEKKTLRFHVLPQAVERFTWAQQRVILRDLQPVALELESSVPGRSAAA